MSDVRTPELVINKLSKQQYESIQNPSDTELYLVPEDEEHKPICYPTTASEVGTTSMVVKSSVSDNGKILTENGFVYNTSGNPTISDTKVICDLGAGFFEKKLENLTMNTEYHIKSYGQNASGLVYGSELVQRTLLNPIPDEYQLVEYIVNDGNQYIDTLIGINDVTGWFFDGIINYSSIQYQMGCGVTTGDYLLFVVNSNSMSFYCGGQQPIAIHKDNWSGIRRTYYIDQYSGFYGIVDVAGYTTTSSCNNNIQLWIGRRNGGGVLYTMPCTIYNNKIYTNNVLIQDLYPVYRISDNKPGMYDIVNGVFYTNQGTGEFTVGPDKEWTDE